MPESYGLMGEHEGRGLIPWAWAEERLAAARNYWVSTTRPDGRPHAIPVWGIWLDDAFFFGTAANSRKARNLAANSSMSVHLDSGDEVVIVEGVVQEEYDSDRLRRYADAYWQKYEIRLDTSDPGTKTFRLSPTRALAWMESDFPSNATRWLFGDA